MTANAPKCAASVSGCCLNLTQGSGWCDIDDGECIHAGRPARAGDSYAEELLRVVCPEDDGDPFTWRELDELAPVPPSRPLTAPRSASQPVGVEPELRGSGAQAGAQERDDAKPSSNTPTGDPR